MKTKDERNLLKLKKNLLQRNQEYRKYLLHETDKMPQLLSILHQTRNYELKSADPEIKNLYEQVQWLANNLDLTWKKWNIDYGEGTFAEKRQFTHYVIQNFGDISTREQQALRLEILLELQNPKTKEPLDKFTNRILEKYQQLKKQYPQEEIIYFWNPQQNIFDLTTEKREYPGLEQQISQTG